MPTTTPKNRNVQKLREHNADAICPASVGKEIKIRQITATTRAVVE